MKKRSIVITLILLIILLLGLCFVGTGFMIRTDVVLVDYTVSEDGSKLTFKAGVSTSMGYIRGFEDKGGGVKPHYLIFYSTFGGFNSSFGAKNEFVLEVGKNDTEIYFNRPDGGYELVLQKNDVTGEWERA